MLGTKDMYDIALNIIQILDSWSHLKASFYLELFTIITREILSFIDSNESEFVDKELSTNNIGKTNKEERSFFRSPNKMQLLR